MQHGKEILYEINGLPVFQNKVYENIEAAKNVVVGDIQLVQNSIGVICNNSYDPTLLNYNDDYQNEQANSSVFRKHLEQVSFIVSNYVNKKQIGVEIGCGKGYFLELMLSKGFDITGFDPAYDGQNQKVRKLYFDKRADIAVDYIILRHTLEHIFNPLEFLRQIAQTNKHRGIIYIEVPCFDWILQKNAFYDIYYEHCNYFTLQVLNNFFKQIITIGHLFGGQYMYVVADLAFLKSRSEIKYKNKISPISFNNTIDSILSKISKAKKTIIWGAGAKGVTLANIAYTKKTKIDYLIDINTLKQNKYIGLSGIKIISPDEMRQIVKDGDTVVIMNSLYAEEIREEIGKFNLDYLEIA